MIPNVLAKLTSWIDRVVPGKGLRTTVIIIAGIGYAILGVVSGHLTAEQATQIILTAFGLLFAAKHTP